MAKVVVLGAGMMGTALCTPLSDAGHEVRLVGTHLDTDWVASMKKGQGHPKLGGPLPERVTPFDLDELETAMVGAELVAVGVSSAGVRWAATTLGPLLRPGLPILSVTKGLEEEPAGVLRVLPEVFRESLPQQHRDEVGLAAIGGPCIAGELAKRVPTSVVFTGRDPSVLDWLRERLATPTYRVTTSTDVIGVEVCAALKNAYAMAVGIGAGIHERLGGKPAPVAHHNLQAAVFAQACSEMSILVRALGGEPDQVPNLAGAGDLFVTCSGGRSSRLGRLLGLGVPFREAQNRMAGDTLESADTVRVVGGALDAMVERGTVSSGSLPLMEHLHEIIVRAQPVRFPFERFHTS